MKIVMLCAARPTWRQRWRLSDDRARYFYIGFGRWLEVLK